MLLAITYLIVLFAKSSLGGTIIVRNVTNCEDPMVPITFKCKVINNDQLCNIAYKAPAAIGENFKAKTDVDMLRGKKWRHLITIKEDKGVCFFLERYAKTIFHEACDKAGKPRQCPFPKGTFKAEGVNVDTNKVSHLIIPKGMVRLHVKAIEKATQKLGLCVNVEAESMG